MIGAYKEMTALKKSSLGPPDIYPQLPDQIEDKLTGDILNSGFILKPRPNEYLTKRVTSISKQQIISFLSDIYDKKHETKPPLTTAKKKQPQISNVVKLLFFPVTPQAKSAVDAWLSNLANGLPFQELLKQVPYFYKKEEMLMCLFKNHVPVDRCAWYIKVSAVLYVQHAENNRKKSNAKNYNPSTEWTNSIFEFIDSVRDSLLSGLVTTLVDTSKKQRPKSFPIQNSHESHELLDFLLDLVEYLYEEKLLSRVTLFKWIIYQTEKYSGNVEFFCWHWNLCFKFANQIIKHVFITRRLAMGAAYTLSGLLQAHGNKTDKLGIAKWSISCCNVKSLVENLVQLISYFVIHCPTAFVQYNLIVSNSIFKYSPVDFLPQLPSELILNLSSWVPEMIEKLKKSENSIIKRSSMCECRWKSYSHISCESGQKLEWGTKCVDILKSVRVSQGYVSMDEICGLLYKEIDDSNENSWNESELLNLLFQWAVFDDDGESQGPVLVAQIIARRLNQLAVDSNEKSGFVNEIQDIFCDFLLNCHIPLTEPCDSCILFTRVCLLVNEMIQVGIFSFSAYMKHLITNGILSIPYNSKHRMDDKMSVCQSNNAHDEEIKPDLFEKPVCSEQQERYLLYLKHFPFETKIEPSLPLGMVSSYQNERLNLIYGFSTKRNDLICKFRQIAFKALKAVSLRSFDHIKEITYFSHFGDFKKLSCSLSKCQVKLRTLPIGDRASVASICASKMLRLFADLLECKFNGELIPVCVVEFILEVLDSSFTVSPLLKFCDNLVKILSKLNEKCGNFVHSYVLAVFFSVVGILEKHRSCFFLNSIMVYDVFVCFLGSVNEKITSVSCFTHLIVIRDFVNGIFKGFPSFKEQISMDYQSFCFDCTRIIKDGILEGFNYYFTLDDNPSIRISPDLPWSSLSMRTISDKSFIQTFVVNTIRSLAHIRDLPKIYQISLRFAEISTLNRILQEELITALHALFDRTSNSVYPAYYSKLNLSYDKMSTEPLIVFISTLVSRRCISMDLLFSLFLSLIPSVPLNLKRLKKGYDLNLFRVLMNIFTFIFNCRSRMSDWAPSEFIYYSLSCLYDRVFTHWSNTMVPKNNMFEFYQHLYGFFVRITSIINIDNSLSRQDTPKLNLFVNNKVAVDEIWSWLSLITSQYWVKKICFFDSVVRDRVLSSQRQESMTNEQYIEMVRHMCFPGQSHFLPLDFTDNSVSVYIGDLLDSVVVWNLPQKVTLLEHIAGPKEVNSMIVHVIFRRIFDSNPVFEQNESSVAVMIHQLLNSSDNANWLISRLIATLPQLQIKVIEEASKLLDDETFCVDSNFGNSGKSRQICVFVGLIEACLLVNPPLRDLVLKSLLSQFVRLIEHSKNICKSDRKNYYNRVLCPFYVRMQLLTKLFDYVIAEQSVNWMVVLSQLILREIVTPDSDTELFMIIYDMITSLAILIDGDFSSSTVEFRKKIRPEMNESAERSRKFISSLLPPEDEIYDEIVKCNSIGHRQDAKSKKSSSVKFDPMGGLQVSDRLYLNPWEIIEGYKGSVLNFSHTSMHNLEGHELKYFCDNRLLAFHTHMNSIPESFYFQEIDTSHMETCPKESTRSNSQPSMNFVQDSPETSLQPSRRSYSQMAQDSSDIPLGMMNRGYHPRYQVPSTYENDFVSASPYRKNRMAMDCLNVRPDQFNPHVSYRQSTPLPNMDGSFSRRPPQFSRPPLLSTYSNSPNGNYMQMHYNQRGPPPTPNHFYTSSNMHQIPYPQYSNVSAYDPYNTNPSPSLISGDGYYSSQMVPRRMRGNYPDPFRFPRNDMYRGNMMYPPPQGYRKPRPNTPDGFHFGSKNRYSRNL